MSMKSSFFKSLVNLGEEKINALISVLLSNEKFINGIQTIIAKSFTAKNFIDERIQYVFSNLNLVTKSDLSKIIRRIDDLEDKFDYLSERIGEIRADIKKLQPSGKKTKGSTITRKKTTKKTQTKSNK